jgi:hypothetical protein
MGLRNRPLDKPVSLLMPTGEPVGRCGEEPEDWPPDEGPLLVPHEGASRLADTPIAEAQADQRRELNCRRLGRLKAALTSQKHWLFMPGLEGTKAA